MTWSPDGETIVIGNRRDVVQWIDVGEQKMIKKGDMGREASLSRRRPGGVSLDG